MKKSELRQQILALRRDMEPQLHYEQSVLAQKVLVCSEPFKRARYLALYSSVNKEVATQDLFTAAVDTGKQVFYPRVKGQTLQFYAVNDLAELTTGCFGVLEPTSGAVINPQGLDLIVVPGVAFDFEGRRLGYGKGFYDRFLVLTSCDCVSVGLGFDFQLSKRLPDEQHDQKVSFLATESGFISCR